MRVLVVEDEPRLNELVVTYLREEGFVTVGCADGETGLAIARETQADAVVLDLMLPRMNGIEVCRELRRDGSDAYIVLATARGALAERVDGLNAGADDYVVKPFAFEELSARLRAAERRQGPHPTARLVVGDLDLDSAARRVWHGGTELSLSRREFALLEALMQNAGLVVGRGLLADRVWGSDIEIASNAIDVHISKLRARIGRVSGRATITTVRGLGYRLEKRSP